MPDPSGHSSKPATEPNALQPAEQAEQLKKRKRWKRTALLIAVLAVVLFGWDTYHLVQLKLTQHTLDKQLADIEKEHARLSGLQDRLQKDEVYVEGLIRSTFKYAKPGELVIPMKNSSEPVKPWQQATDGEEN